MPGRHRRSPAGLGRERPPDEYHVHRDYRSVSATSHGVSTDVVGGPTRRAGIAAEGFAKDIQLDGHGSHFRHPQGPLSTIRAVYTAVGRGLEWPVEERMESFLAAHPGDDSGSRYSFADTGLDVPTLRERSRPYLESFGVVPEPLT